MQIDWMIVKDELEISSGSSHSVLNELQQPLHRTGVNKLRLSVILSIECLLSCLTEKCRPDAPVRFKGFLKHLSLLSFVQLTSSKVKTPCDAA